ncbi:MAG: UDP-N-acetylmuramoyl-L-alanyl-D-glutamate--2,6-diaminopimelate ligase [Planctomycetes bacterium]|nr:UDP-N-acetylmuramoyl-L-alanyl-D-glutamate--2,6-diaminopimelate ligase [Planctomycetota bacterium]
MTLGSASNHGIALRQVLPEAELFGADEIRVSSCCADSRQVRPGDLFVALSGVERDGHDFVADAVARGAAAVLAERPIQVDVPVACVADARRAYGHLCQALVGNPSQRLKVIGVTGTNGKTTTTHLIAGVLRAAGQYPAVLGTLGYSDGVEFEAARWTTPPAPVLAAWMARAEAAGCTHVVMEVSSHALEQSRVAGVEFDVVAVTNVRHDHLDYHQTLSAYRAAKARLFEQLGPSGVVVLNVEDDVCREMYLPRVDGPALTVALDRAAELNAVAVESCLSEQTFLLQIGSESVPVRTRLIGRHNIENCLVAAAVGLAYGVSTPDVVRGLESVDRLAGRLEPIVCGQSFGVYVDYAHTPDALAGVLDALREMTSGRVLCVFGAGGRRDRSKRPLMARAVELRADLAIVTSDNPRDESQRRIVADIMRGFAMPEAVHVIDDRAAAICYALQQAREGDVVLIAGKGHEEYQELADGQIDFDDRQVARDWLYAQWNSQSSRAA